MPRFLKQYTKPQRWLGVSLIWHRNTLQYSNIRFWASNVLHPVVYQSKNAFIKAKSDLISFYVSVPRVVKC